MEAVELGVEIVTDVSLSVPASATLGIVGESGCGKTTVAMALLGFARPGTTITSGTVMVDGTRPPRAGRVRAEARARTGHLLRPAEPGAGSLCPGMRVGQQLEEMLDPGIVLGRNERSDPVCLGGGRSCRSTRRCSRGIRTS